jgi:hypothetical protein
MRIRGSSPCSSLSLRGTHRDSPDSAHRLATQMPHRRPGAAAILERFEDQLASLGTIVWPATVAAVFGALILALALTWGRTRLEISPAPFESPPAVAFSGPAPQLAKRGIVLGANLQASGCHSPVEVTIVASGTAEYWRRNRRTIPRNARFELKVDDPTIAHVTAGLASAADNLDLGNAFVRAVGPRRVARRLRCVRIQRGKDQTVVTGHIENWRRTWSAVYVHFFANWFAPRGRGSCYVRCPPASGLRRSTSLASRST